MPDLKPLDALLCQRVKVENLPFPFGRETRVNRCAHPVQVIATEETADADGRRSSMGLCGDCTDDLRQIDPRGDRWSIQTVTPILQQQFTEALERIRDMLAQDDGQAFQEARKFLERIGQE